MIFNDLRGFSIDPPYFDYNSAEQENPLRSLGWNYIHTMKIYGNYKVE
jgi:hypothetical protein